MNPIMTLSVGQKDVVKEFRIQGSIVTFGRQKKKWKLNEAYEDNDFIILYLERKSTREHESEYREVAFPRKGIYGFDAEKKVISATFAGKRILQMHLSEKPELPQIAFAA
jgi:hypothetical protein